MKRNDILTQNWTYSCLIKYLMCHTHFLFSLLILTHDLLIMSMYHFSKMNDTKSVISRVRDAKHTPWNTLFVTLFPKPQTFPETISSVLKKLQEQQHWQPGINSTQWRRECYEVSATSSHKEQFTVAILTHRVSNLDREGRRSRGKSLAIKLKSVE